MDRNLPDEQLHDLYKELAIKWDELCDIHTRIYEHIELKMNHQEVIRKMVNETKKR